MLLNLKNFVNVNFPLFIGDKTIMNLLHACVKAKPA